MSFGKSSGSSNSQSQSQSQATLDPDIKNALLGNVQRATGIANTPYTPYTGELVAGFTPAQKQAQGILSQIATSDIGTGLLNNAANAANSAATYNPSTVTNQTINPSTINRGDIANVTSGPITADQLKAYQNPYEDDVVSAALKDLQKQYGIASAQNDSKSVGAYGGARQGVADALTAQNFFDSSGATTANLRSQGFNTALSAAQADANRALTAAQGNQNVDLSVAGQNAGILNSAATNNAANSLAAQTANQNAGLTANGQKLSASGILSSLSDQQLTQALKKAGVLSSVGDAQQAQQQAVDDANKSQFDQQINWPALMQQLLNQSLGLVGNPVLNSSSSSSNSTGKTSNVNFNSGFSYAMGGS